MSQELQEILRELRELKAKRAPPELWDTKAIAAYMGKSPRTVERWAAKPGFPKPICPRNRRWFEDEVVKFLRIHRKAA